MAQLVKNVPTMQKTQVQFLGQKDLLEKEWNGSPLQYSCLENAMDREAWQVWGRKESDLTETVPTELMGTI